MLHSQISCANVVIHFQILRCATDMHEINDWREFKSWSQFFSKDQRQVIGVWPSPVAVTNTVVTLCKTQLSMKSQSSWPSGSTHTHTAVTLAEPQQRTKESKTSKKSTFVPLFIWIFWKSIIWVVKDCTNFCISLKNYVSMWLQEFTQPQ